MYPTLCYVLLVAVTIFEVIISYKIYKRSNSLVPIFPILIIYLWSIYGAWTWIPLKLQGYIFFYETIMFNVYIDSYYFISLSFYSLFLIIFSVYELAYLNRLPPLFRHQNNSKQWLSYIEHLSQSKIYRLIILSLLLLFLFFSYKDISKAISSGVSAYKLSRFDSELGSLEYFVMFCGNTFVYLSIPLFFTKSKIKKIFPIALFSLFYLCSFYLGNRGTLLSGLIITFLLYSEIYGVKKALRPRNIVLGILMLSAIQIISILRGISADELLTNRESIAFSNVLLSLLTSPEFYAAHISMYGVLKFEVDYTWGSSILFLFSALIPSFLGFERPKSIYEYYVLGTIGHRPEYGVTINHITGWYLNFGFIAIIIGAITWAAVLKYFFIRKSKFIYMYGAVIFSGVSSQMIRSGIEAYKGVLLLATLVPFFIIWQFGKRHKKSKYKFL